MAKADLTQERLRELFQYNEETGVFTRKVTVAPPKAMAGMIAGSLGNQGYLLIMVDRRTHMAHRLAWLYVHGVFPKGDIDHINGVRSDNRIANLRDASRSLNIQNSHGPRPTNKSGFLGVCWSKKEAKWVAQITLNYKNTRIGSFDSPEEAHAAYLLVKRQVHLGCTI
jgi:hypothetical protein